ncbi:MAG: FAD-dependent oxidoreductase [Myxococcales bacterium]|nr:FAD-dependent oxidoreductase [Myxococcales bacterium]
MSIHLPHLPIAVVGAGVSGLSCAILLQEAGAQVTILSKAPTHQTTSAKAAAIWFPFEAQPQDRVNAWSLRSWQIFEQLSAQPETGVSFLELVELCENPTPVPWWHLAAPSYRRLLPEERPPQIADAFAISVPLTETPRYLPYLQQRFLQAGGHLQIAHLSDLTSLFPRYRLVVHCAGLGAKQLAQDPSLFPIRGHILKVRCHEPITRAWTHPDPPLAYIIPRSQDCILGGTAEKDRDDLIPDPHTTQTILSHCRDILSSLDRIEILEEDVGLRPGRPTVRLEAEPTAQGTILHNYGHGGAGFTLSWGCAEEILQLAHQHLQHHKETP